MSAWRALASSKERERKKHAAENVLTCFDRGGKKFLDYLSRFWEIQPTAFHGNCKLYQTHPKCDHVTWSRVTFKQKKSVHFHAARNEIKYFDVEKG